MFIVEESVVTQRAIDNSSFKNYAFVTNFFFDHPNFVAKKDMTIYEGEDLVEVLIKKDGNILASINAERVRLGKPEVIFRGNSLTFLSLSPEWTNMNYSDIELLPRNRDLKKRFLVIKSNKPREFVATLDIIDFITTNLLSKTIQFLFYFFNGFANS